MKLTDSIKLFWEQQTGKQKFVVIGIGTIILFLILSGWIDSAYSLYQVRKAERAAAKAKIESNQALERAAKIAAEIRQKEFELKELEKKRDVKKTELDKVHRETVDAQSDYDRAVREPIATTPSTDKLCADLAKLGYPCR
jgi:biopolymer transport protein ExbB/TolQ